MNVFNKKDKTGKKYLKKKLRGGRNGINHSDVVFRFPLETILFKYNVIVMTK